MVTVLVLKDKTNVFSTTTVQTQPADGCRDINIPPHAMSAASLPTVCLADGGLLVGDTLSGLRCQRSCWSSAARQPSQ